MILGMSIATSTLVHVVISLIGIVSGLIVLFGMFGSRRLPGWTALFLLTTILTSVTGFMVGLTPARIFGIISLLVLARHCSLFMASGSAARGVGSTWVAPCSRFI